jgi:asparagine synthase (glutamine-hydrolysing)
MCGIAGVYWFKEPPLVPDVLHRMSDALAHRGPDAEGFYISEGVGLASRRLKIIDLTAAASQPMHDESGRFHLVFNGEIYNFRRLRKSLQADFPFFSQSDSEVILRIFQHFGLDCWKQLNGMFAIAIFDEKNRELLLARDHAGIKPIFYYQDDHKFAFASEIKALLASSVVTAEIDREALSLYLQLGYFPVPFTAYKNIRKIPPGCYMRIHREGIEIHPFWNIRNIRTDPKTDPNQMDELDSLFNRAVQDQMISDVPLGAFLSGGIDSSLIVALMSKRSDIAVKTFTAGFTNMGYYDERPYAQKVAALFKTEHHEFTIQDRIDTLVPKLSGIFDEPFADSSAIPTLCLAQLARQHVTVALSGTGGDEIFGGYRKYMAAHWAPLYASLPESIKAGIQKTVGLLPSSRKTLWQERALLLQRFSALTSNLPAGFQLNRIFLPGEAEQLLDTPAHLPGFKSIDATLAENMMLFDYEFFLPEDLLVKEDRCTMAFGLEARVPYLDREVIEFMSRLPLQYKVSRGQTKRLFKKVASRYLPTWVLRRPKHGFGSPVAEWLRSDLKELAKETLFAPGAFLKAPLIKQRFDEHQSGIADHSRQLWALLMLELWYQDAG